MRDGDGRFGSDAVGRPRLRLATLDRGATAVLETADGAAAEMVVPPPWLRVPPRTPAAVRVPVVLDEEVEDRFAAGDTEPAIPAVRVPVHDRVHPVRYRRAAPSPSAPAAVPPVAPLVPGRGGIGPARPRIVEEPGILGLSRLTRGRAGSRLFTLSFVAVYAIIFVQLVLSLLHG